MVRRYNNRGRYYPRYRSARTKYQFVPFSMTMNFTGEGLYQLVVPSFAVAGVRKAKNFNVNFVTSSVDPLLYALVYLPEGAEPNTFQPTINTNEAPNTFTELFAANQWVIACGSISQGAQNKVFTRMSRNLNNGDSIYLYVWKINNNDDAVAVNATGSYAIKYN